MNEKFSRNVNLWGEQGQRALSQATVAVFGLGGVGCACAEALARSGVGKLVLCDDDSYVESNLNRQLFATLDTLGKNKVDAARERIAKINEDCRVETFYLRFDENTADKFDFSAFDYVCDCIDSVSSKVLLVEKCKQAQTPIVCCMGTGNKTDPTALKVADVSQTTVCPLARAFRKALKEKNLSSVECVFSAEQPQREFSELGAVPSSCAFVPCAAGFVVASVAVNGILKSAVD